MVPSLDPQKPSFLSAFVSDLQPRHLITVAVLVALSIALTRVINLAFKQAVDRHRRRGTLLPETATQLALTRRLLDAAVWFTAVAIGLSQFPDLRVLSTGLLASAGISGLVVGFAARSTLGNAIAGITISLAQPIRIGDDIEFRGDRGVVEDIHLLFTVLKSLLEIAQGYEGLDRDAAAPEVYWVKIDELGTLLRLVAACTDSASSDRLGQIALAGASRLVWRRAL